MEHLQKTSRALAVLALATLSLSACSSNTTTSPSPSESSSPTASPTPTPEPTTPEPTTPEPTVEAPAPAEPPITEEATPTPAPTVLTPPVNDGFTIDPASLVTTELAQGTPVDPAAFAFDKADQPSVVFQTPDPQVACLMQPYGVFCMTDDSKNWVLQSVSMGPTATSPRSVQAQGRAATHDWFKTNTPLQEGQSLSWMGLTCTVTGPVTVQCTNGITTFNMADLPDR